MSAINLLDDCSEPVCSPLTLALSPREREPEELLRAAHAPSPQLWGERAGVRGIFSSARTSVVQFQAGGLAAGSRWWSAAEPPDSMSCARLPKDVSRRDAGRVHIRAAASRGEAFASCVPPGRDLEGRSIVRLGSGGFRSRSLASPLATIRQASGLHGVFVSCHGMSCASALFI